MVDDRANPRDFCFEDVTPSVSSWVWQRKDLRVPRLERGAAKRLSGRVGKKALAKAREEPGRGRNIRYVSTGLDYCQGNGTKDLPFELRQE